METRPVWISTLAMLFITLGATDAPTQGLGRLEVHTLPSVTVSNQQFLTGYRYGRPVTVAGELRLPKGNTDKFPAVVLIHGSGGVSGATDRWAHELNAVGVAAFILDSFTGRGIVNTNSDQSQLDSIAMMHDAFAALDRLSTHPRVDPIRIAVMGFSKGAVPAIYSSNLRFRKLYGPANAEFAAHIGLYTPCNVSYREQARVADKPIRMFHGIADDYVSIEPCRAYAKRLKETGADVALTEFPDAYHAYDNPAYADAVALPNAQTTRHCLIMEGESGVMLNSETGQPYTLQDSCVEKGPHVGYNAAAHQGTVQALKQFLASRLKVSSN